MDAPDIALWVVNCTTGNSFVARFATEDVALSWVRDHESTHTVSEVEDEPLPDAAQRLYEYLYPTCEHGLSASLCAGTGHYPPDLSYF